MSFIRGKGVFQRVLDEVIGQYVKKPHAKYYS
jgi:hypothetical protein